MEASYVWKKSFRYSVYCGFCPHSILGHSFVSKKKSFPYTVLMNIIFGSAVVGELYEAKYFPADKLHLTFVSAIPPETYLVTTFFSFYVHWREQDFLNLLQKMMESDWMFSQLKCKPPKDVSTAPDLFMVALILLLAAMRWYFRSGFFEIASLCFVDLAMLISLQPFTAILYNLRSRLTLLKRVLVATSRNRDLNAARKAEKIATILQLHDLLCSNCQDLNSLFSMQLLYSFFQGIIFIGWYSYRISVLATGHENVMLIVTKILPVIKVSFACCYITTFCRQASLEANDFSSLVHHLMINDDNDVITNRKLRFHILMKKKLEFTACGFFALDYTLLHAMVATSTTYLVLLLQYG